MKQIYISILTSLLWLLWLQPLMAQERKPAFVGTVTEVASAFKAKISTNARSRTGSSKTVSHQLPGQPPLVIHVQSGKQEGTEALFYGEVEDAKNSHFYLQIAGDEVSGTIVMTEQQKYFRYFSQNSQVYLQEQDIDSVLCIGFPESPEKTPPLSGNQLHELATIPHLESLPGAEAVVYLDFDGQTVTNTLWNNSFNSGEPIEAAPANLSVTEMIEAWKIMSEDFRPFALNITTSEAVFNRAPTNRRMRVIFSPTNYFYPGYGGVAYLDSFTWGSSFYGETPCWVFNSFFGKYAGEAGSHEVGHTLSLSHDGRNSPSETYYYGHDSWAPIMGAGYFVPLVQWSEGEYPFADNQEDDLEKIVAYNGFGYRNDDHGNNKEMATPLVADEEGTIDPAVNKGVIQTSSDVDVFSFTTNGSTVDLTVSPDPDHPNLNLSLTLKNSSNTVVASDEDNRGNASIIRQLPAGTYYLYVDGERGPLGANSDYGSLGDYSVSGNLNDKKIPIISITSPENGAVFTAPATIEITTTHLESYPNLVMVDFHARDINGDLHLADDRIAPFSYTWTGVEAGTYHISARAIDPRLGIVDISTVTVHVLPGVASGAITRELWTGVHGADISNIPLYTKPTIESELSSFEAPTNIGDNYGQRIRGFVQAPETGEYTFWIAADDVAELWLSTSEDPAHKQKIAQVNHWTYPQEWTRYETQQSGKVMLEAGKRYYIEALHKEQGGGDNLAVGWQRLGGELERPIGGNRLSPYDGTGTISQQLWKGVHGAGISKIPLQTKPTTTSELGSFEAPTNIGDNYGQRIRGFVRAPQTGEYTLWIAADDVAELWLSTSDNPADKQKIAQVNSWTYPQQWHKFATQQSVGIRLEAGKRYYIEALHKEQGGGDNLAVGWQLPDGNMERPIGGNRLIPFDGTGSITHEFWAGVHGSDISSIPLSHTPTRIGELNLFETPANVGDNYGQRVRGFVRAPETGEYSFWIAADDVAELWLSNSENPADKVKIAQVDSWTYSREWNKYDSQQSAPIPLVAGKRYYIEALHKEQGGGDNLAVGWQLPGGELERPIGGGRLTPYGFSPAIEMFAVTTNVYASESEDFTVYPNPVATGGAVQVALEKAYPVVSVTFYDLGTGRTLQTQEFRDEQVLQLELTDVPRGLYGLKVAADGKSWVRKLMVR